MIRLRLNTPEEDDQSGFSDPNNCGICKGAQGHHCGGCGKPLEHQQGSTCSACWSMIFSSYGPEEHDDD